MDYSTTAFTLSCVLVTIYTLYIITIVCARLISNYIRTDNRHLPNVFILAPCGICDWHSRKPIDIIMRGLFIGNVVIICSMYVFPLVILAVIGYGGLRAVRHFYRLNEKLDKVNYGRKDNNKEETT